MTFHGPTFPSETHYETLIGGRQRFGNRSANMFFVRPARHIACPRRLKYIHDIKTGYIPYVEDAAYENRPSFKHVLQKDDDMSRSTGFGLYNSADAWRDELMELAQQVKSSLVSTDEQDQYFRSPRSSRLNRPRQKRSTSSTSSYNVEENDEQNISKRLLQRRASSRRQRSQGVKTKQAHDKSELEQAMNDENQDAGIWLIPILCYILQTDNILEAQDWLVNANPTEKRFAMELISRTMQDMQTHDNDLCSDVSNSDSLSSAYWPYKIWQRQEKDRQQQQIQNFLKQSKLSSSPSLPPLVTDNNDTCERATSPLRILTPAKRLSTANTHSTPVETTVIERSSPVRSSHDRATPTIVVRQNQTPTPDRPATVKRRLSSRLATPITPRGNEHTSRRGYRVTTSMNDSTDVEANRASLTFRGKTPLI